MHKKIIVILLLFSSFCPQIGAEELKVENRGNGWTLNTFDPTSLEPTTLKYFHYFDVLPEEINFEIFKDMDLSAIGDKKLYVGYGIADAKGKDCISLPVEVGGVKETREVPSINKCIATGKFDEYKSTLFKQATRGIKIEGLEEQIRNAIATEN